jgi:hypothetical protein
MVLLSFTAPTRPLSENESRRLHWAARNRRLKDWAVLADAAWRHADNKESLVGQRIAIHVTLPFSRKARRDSSNYIGTNVKCILDALIRAGMAPDDTPEYIEVIDPKIAIDPTGEVLVLLRPLGEVVK